MQSKQRYSPAQMLRLDQNGVQISIRQPQLKIDLLRVRQRAVLAVLVPRPALDEILSIRGGHALGPAQELPVEGEGAHPRRLGRRCCRRGSGSIRPASVARRSLMRRCRGRRCIWPRRRAAGG